MCVASPYPRLSCFYGYVERGRARSTGIVRFYRGKVFGSCTIRALPATSRRPNGSPVLKQDRKLFGFLLYLALCAQSAQAAPERTGGISLHMLPKRVAEISGQRWG